jgi:transposase
MHTHQNSSNPVATIGVDIGKNTFHLVGLDKRGAIVLRTKVSRSQLERRLANVPCCLVGLEAGCGSHHIARQIRALGHDVRLIPAQYVKAFLKGHKNDYRDAEAIAEAVQRPTMNFVAIKTPEQSDLLSLHRVRSRLVSQRTAVINQIRGFLIERGITVRQGPAPLRKALPDILSSSPEVLSPRMVRLIAHLSEDWRHLDERIQAVSTEIETLAENDDRTKLGKISKRGNKYLRTLFVQAAHVVLVRRPAAAMRGLWPWIEQAAKRLAHRNLLAIALANKLARIAWAVLARGRDYEPRTTINAA